MPKPNGPLASLSRAEREALAGEILGASVTVHAAPGLAADVEGTLVDETLSTFLIRLPARRRPVRVAKHRLDATVRLPNGELHLSGDALRVRPEDRTKRLLAAGPRRYR